MQCENNYDHLSSCFLLPSSSHIDTYPRVHVRGVRTPCREKCIGELLLFMSTGSSIGGYPVLRVNIIGEWGATIVSFDLAIE